MRISEPFRGEYLKEVSDTRVAVTEPPILLSTGEEDAIIGSWLCFVEHPHVQVL
jgi:hypothetical protein